MHREPKPDRILQSLGNIQDTRKHGQVTWFLPFTRVTLYYFLPFPHLSFNNYDHAWVKGALSFADCNGLTAVVIIP